MICRRIRKIGDRSFYLRPLPFILSYLIAPRYRCVCRRRGWWTVEGSPSGRSVGSECYRGDVYIAMSPPDIWPALGWPRLPTDQEETPGSPQLLRARHRHYRMEKTKQLQELIKKTKGKIRRHKQRKTKRSDHTLDLQTVSHVGGEIAQQPEGYGFQTQLFI